MPQDEFSWDDPLRSYATTWRRVMGSPREFFAADHPGTSLQAPIGFLIVTLAIGGGGLALFGWGFRAIPIVLIAGFLRVVLGGLAFWLVATRLLGGSGDYAATLRVLAYASAVGVFICLPRIRILAGLYGLYLVVIGLENAHRFEATRAVLTVIIGALVFGAVVYAFGLHHLMHPVHPAWWAHRHGHWH
jgi:hypothetical protein